MNDVNKDSSLAGVRTVDPLPGDDQVGGVKGPRYLDMAVFKSLLFEQDARKKTGLSEQDSDEQSERRQGSDDQFSDGDERGFDGHDNEDDNEDDEPLIFGPDARL